MKKLFLLMLLTGILFSCNQSPKEVVKKEIKKIIMKDDDGTAYEMIADTVKYLIPLDKDSITDAPPFFVGFDKEKFISQLVDSVLSGKVKAYDYFDNSEMTISQIRQQMGLNVDTTFIEDPETGEMQKKVITTEFNPDDVRELYVYERWFYSPEKVRFKTEIIGFAPVRFTIKDDQPDGEVTKIILFTIFQIKK
ncbi:MAG: hypothetical protein DRP35_07465 [Candidatus Zixiibacteriota bacterium]|nr:MAG: hypothetical protein DRP35_07465 [candidate division Zixibacteria bacterium]